MGKQTNQYTKVRTSGNVQDDDLLDFDSTEDSGSTFESAKITVLNFVNYLKTKIDTLYTADGSIDKDREITAGSHFTRWTGGDIINRMNDLVNDYGFKIQDSSSVEKASLEFDQSTSSAKLELSDAGGVYLYANDGFLGINTTDNTDIFGIVDMTVNGAFQVKERITFLNSGLMTTGGGYAKYITRGAGVPAQFGTFNSSDEVAVVRGATAVITSTPTGTAFNSGLGVAATEDFQFYGTETLSKNQHIARATSGGSTITEAQQDLISRYWDGAVSQDKVASVYHNITAAPAGTSQLETSIGGVELMRLDEDSTAGNTRFMIYDVDNGTLERVSVGAADSGGVGYKVLRIPN